MKTIETPLQLLEAAIDNALIRAENGLGIEDQARLLIEEEKELIDALTPEWQLRAVVRLIRLKRLEAARSQRLQNQFLLPGFEQIPQRIVIQDGKRRPLADATYRQLRDYFEVLRARTRNNPQVAQVKALMLLVRQYAKKEPGITVRQVCERENGR